MRNNVKTTSGIFLMAMMVSANGVSAASSDRIAEQRALQVAARPEAGAVGIYGLPMEVLVAHGVVEPARGWDRPETAKWANGYSSAEDFLADEAAQREAFAYYLNGLYEHLHTRTIDLKVEVGDRKLGVNDLIGLSAFGVAPYKIAILAQEKDPSILDAEAGALGVGRGEDLLLSLVGEPRDYGHDLA